jgi:hypothetical protein
VGLGCRRRWRYFLEVVRVQRARSTALHLFKIIFALYITHEKQAFERLHVRARCDHVHRHRDARVVAIAELREYRFGIFGRLVRDFFAEFIALAKLLADDLDNVVRVAVRFGKN